MTLITWLIGMALLGTFLGILLWWIKAPSLTVIVLVVLVLQVWDFLRTLRASDGRAAP